MPILYNYECNQSECNFRIKGYGGPYMYLKWEGKEELLPHPAEDRTAMKITGKNLDQLFKDGLIIFKNSKLCLKCLNYKKNCVCENSKFVEIPKLEGRTCPKCKKGLIKKYEVGIS